MISARTRKRERERERDKRRDTEGGREPETARTHTYTHIFIIYFDNLRVGDQGGVAIDRPPATSQSSIDRSTRDRKARKRGSRCVRGVFVRRGLLVRTRNPPGACRTLLLLIGQQPSSVSSEDARRLSGPGTAARRRGGLVGDNLSNSESTASYGYVTAT